ncbi:hypothetical protein ACS0TY_015019 [Phlomoides rotata]
MAPLRGNKRKRKVENNDEEKFLISGSPGDGFGEWWDVLTKKTAGEPSTSRGVDSFRAIFGMSRKTFDYICSLVRDRMMSRTHYTFINGNPMSLQDQVALALRRLGSGNSLILTGDLFGVHHSTVSQVTWRFVEAIEEKRLLHLVWPSTEEELAEVKCKFEKIRGLPNCCGAIDTTHISMQLTSSDQDANYWLDRKEKHSMILQAIVDADMRFLDIVAGWPGKLNESTVHKSSNFFKKCQNGEILNGSTIFLSEETELGEYIIGDQAFPLLPWLLTPYQGKKLSERKIDFNKRLIASQFVAHKAFVRLKETWKMIKGDLWRPDKNKLPRIILACCILHNILIDKEKDEDLEQFPSILLHDPGYKQEVCEAVDKNGSVGRDKLVKYFSGR